MEYYVLYTFMAMKLAGMDFDAKSFVCLRLLCRTIVLGYITPILEAFLTATKRSQFRPKVDPSRNPAMQVDSCSCTRSGKQQRAVHGGKRSMIPAFKSVLSILQSPLKMIWSVNSI
jgi:hypothetical protein